MAIRLVQESGQLLLRFSEEIHPVQGPLPELTYKLVGLWQHNTVLLRAYFEAEQIPMEHKELGFFRWEPALTTLRAKYCYFSVPGGAGMFLKPALVTRTVRQWDSVPQSLGDICGNFGPLSLQELVKSHL